MKRPVFRHALACLGLLSVETSCGLLPQQQSPCTAARPCAPTAFVLGQPDAGTNNCVAAYQSPLHALPWPSSSGTGLAVADAAGPVAGSAGRVLLWSALPAVEQPANVTLGQPDAASIAFRGTGPDSLPGPTSISTDGSRFIASDVYRVLLWNRIPLSSGAPADLVLGQTALDLLSPPPTISAATFNSPSYARLLSSNGQSRIFVTDTNAHRILVWNQIPAQPGAPADLVLGQPNFTSGLANVGGTQPTQSSLNMPSGPVASDGMRLAIADTNNNRVLIWNNLPTQQNQPADAVIGQLDFTTRAPGCATAGRPDRLAAPAWVAMTPPPDVKLLVYDAGNQRALRFTLPIMPTDAAADLVLGQADGQTCVSQKPTPSSFGGQGSIESDGNALVIADSANQRVLVWDGFPTQHNQPASRVLGQPRADTSIAPCAPPLLSRQRFGRPTGVTGAGTYLAMVDEQLARVVIWTQLPQKSSDSPEILIGNDQGGATYTPGLANNRFAAPSAISTDGKHLVVADSGNNRVLIWNDSKKSSSENC